MKLKYFLLLIFTFGLVACPGESDEFFTIDYFSVQSVIAESCEVLSEDDSIKWDEFAILLNFKTTQELELVSNYQGGGNVLFAARSRGFIANSPIISLAVKSGNAMEKDDLSNIFSTYRYKQFYSETIQCLGIMAIVNFEEQWILKDNQVSKNYLKLNEAPSENFTGKFYIDIGLENGQILKDSTQVITILKN
ncbi:hypothetical protein QUH73_14860 [Labilibaculum sp. K2S]|uniref:hypothetical protein n=1 Tax=Labilibaculum sp. K2S TaxID=3056386 RepID=UPI0025A3D9A0|nr:hypothetical protein [Labilibaculum sp. K2S]MDM8161103.1 hypothetical protein [Labilibaculum sp. K2S]